MSLLILDMRPERIEEIGFHCVSDEYHEEEAAS